VHVREYRALGVPSPVQLIGVALLAAPAHPVNDVPVPITSAPTHSRPENRSTQEANVKLCARGKLDTQNAGVKVEVKGQRGNWYFSEANNKLLSDVKVAARIRERP